MKNQIGNYRWRILALLFFATTINYMDRSIIGVLGPTMKNHVFFWTDQDYANINMSFMLAYAIGLLIMGGVIDKIGTRKGYVMSIGIWSIFGMLHSIVTKSMGWIGFAAARFGLGFGESGNFPSAIKTVGEWFPQKERSLATGLFNAGSNVGAILTPLIIPLIVTNDGKNWQFVFLITGALSAIWVVAWFKTYQKPELHPKLSENELTYIQSDSVLENESKKISYFKLLTVKETWAYMIVKTTDAVWLFYIFWAGFFLNRQYGLELTGLALPLIIIYLVADIGSVAGGLISTAFVKNGWTVNRARKITMLLCTVFIFPVILAPQVNNQWLSVIFIAMAAGGHQAWSANLMTVPSDLFPKGALASIGGLGGMVGYSLGIATNLMLGKVLTNSGSIGYVYAFSIAGSLYIVTLFIFHLITPGMTPLDENLKLIEKH